MGSRKVLAPEEEVEYEELFNAAFEGSLERLQAALLPSMDINAVDSDRLQGRAALHIAAGAGHVPAIRWLIARGATVDLRNAECETPLHVAASCDHLEAIKALIEAGADIGPQSADYHFTPMHKVLDNKSTVTPQQIETIIFFLDQGLDVNTGAFHWSCTVLDQAILLRCSELVEILIERGARFKNALQHAHEHNVAKVLFSRGEKILSELDKLSAITNLAGGWTTDPETIRFLVSQANDMELDKSREALIQAAAYARTEVAQILIEHKFDVNVTTDDSWVGRSSGRTPLLAACECKRPAYERIEILKLLLRNGADVNARNEAGTTAAEMLLKDDSLLEDTELQQLLAEHGPR